MRYVPLAYKLVDKSNNGNSSSSRTIVDRLERQVFCTGQLHELNATTSLQWLNHSFSSETLRAAALNRRRRWTIVSFQEERRLSECMVAAAYVLSQRIGE